MKDGYGIRYHRYRDLGVPWHRALYAALPARLHVLVATVRDQPIAYRLHIHGVLVLDHQGFPTVARTGIHHGFGIEELVYPQPQQERIH